MIVRQRWNSPMGDLLLQATSEALSGVWFFDQKYAPTDFIETHPMPFDAAPTEAQDAQSSGVMEATICWLERYYANAEEEPARPALAPPGTDFQQCVWNALLAIPYGQTTTYGELAQSIDKPKAVRAVAAAVGRNPISLIIPCHRVIGASGSLTGYAGGLNRKQGLLELEHGCATQLDLV